jgi:hypothetical protein
VAIWHGCFLEVSIDELKALANCELALADQTRLDDLVARNAESLLLADEVAESGEGVAFFHPQQLLRPFLHLRPAAFLYYAVPQIAFPPQCLNFACTFLSSSCILPTVL